MRSFSPDIAVRGGATTVPLLSGADMSIILTSIPMPAWSSSLYGLNNLGTLEELRRHWLLALNNN
jgi:hypothetical protein